MESTRNAQDIHHYLLWLLLIGNLSIPNRTHMMRQWGEGSEMRFLMNSYFLSVKYYLNASQSVTSGVIVMAGIVCKIVASVFIQKIGLITFGVGFLLIPWGQGEVLQGLL